LTTETTPADRPSIVVLQHEPGEGLGTFGPVLSAHAELAVLVAPTDPVAYRHAIDDLVRRAAYDAVVVLGGPMGVYERETYEWLDDSLHLLRDAVRRDVPILGICLGAQLLAHVLGAQVHPGRTRGMRKEIGWFALELTQRGKVDPGFHGFDEHAPVFHWHGDTYTLPEGAWLLAGSQRYPQQAFRWGRWVYGLQFHMEVTEDMVATWTREGADELAPLDDVDPATLVELAGHLVPPMWDKVRVFTEYFLELVDEARREKVAAT
jgi:GMP synthase (glutamine-hydrolysing)